MRVNVSIALLILLVSAVGCYGIFQQNSQQKLLTFELRQLTQLVKKIADEARQQRGLPMKADSQYKVVAVAAAEANRLEPGSTYRGNIFLLKSLTSPTIRMTCDGRPLSIDSDGAGLVSFIAPTKRGVAFWQATINAKIEGRDTTFHLSVPYRVVRR